MAESVNLAEFAAMLKKDEILCDAVYRFKPEDGHEVGNVLSKSTATNFTVRVSNSAQRE